MLLFQINVELKNDGRREMRINIVDVLKPADDVIERHNRTRALSGLYNILCCIYDELKLVAFAYSISQRYNIFEKSTKVIIRFMALKIFNTGIP